MSTETTRQTRSRPRRADVRAQVIQAAAEAFAAHSYADVSVTAIAASAGFTKGAVYSNFGGKPQLFAAVFAEQFTELVGGALSDALAAVDVPGSDAPRAVAASLTRGVVRGPLPALLAEFRGLAARDPELAAVYSGLRLRQRLELEELLRGVADRFGVPDGLDLTVAATLLLTTVNSLAVEHATAPEAFPADLVEAILTHVMTGILA
ncbi:DNA-binding transcriptional regulator, AcrR family [Friedmanniella luteola]|uniref:DNA-binding transcriptional regulator, AcrR family n=1 Tax=Friedmanniella luteola TaxID=546871 RepID=A0A1H1ZW16_9ACTN|nr:TetR/AcrR family transcriptional regulator [Friedmanniella luteola]SDT37918.1 DNA-binding transcriptional regulator, AcrR family [Friedmanniella luteola]